MNSKRALIIGATGQDGAYLAKHLLTEGYEVISTCRDHRATSTEHVEADTESRPADISVIIADPSRVRSVLLWKAETCGEALIDRLVQAELSGAAY